MEQQYRDRLWDVFWDEAREKLEEMHVALAVIVQDATDRESAAVLSRGGHTLKGNAATMGLQPVADLAGRVEQAAATIGSEGTPPDPEMVAALSKALAVLGDIAAAKNNETTEECASATAELDAQLAARAGNVK